MNFVSLAKSFTRVTGTGVTVLTSGPCVVEGLFVSSVLTAQLFQAWHGSATGTPWFLVIDSETMMNVASRKKMMSTSGIISMRAFLPPPPPDPCIDVSLLVGRHVGRAGSHDCRQDRLIGYARLPGGIGQH